MWNNVLRYKGQDYLSQRYFILALTLAFLLHLAGFYAWIEMPAASVIDIPVRVLNIKLGGDEPSPDELKAVQPKTNNNNQVEDYLSKLVRVEEQQKEEAIEKTLVDPVKQPARQYVHHNPKAVLKPEGSDIGNSKERDADLMTRYEQLISLWVVKFKIYPDEARSQSIEGNGLVRIRIDREGNVIFCAIAKSTGSPILDQAMVDMVRRANPVPAVPNNYPPGDLQEFVIGVNFFLGDSNHETQ